MLAPISSSSSISIKYIYIAQDRQEAANALGYNYSSCNQTITDEYVTTLVLVIVNRSTELLQG